MEVVPSLSQGGTAAAQCGLFTHKSVPVIFEPPCILVFSESNNISSAADLRHVPGNFGAEILNLNSLTNLASRTSLSESNTQESQNPISRKTLT